MVSWTCKWNAVSQRGEMIVIECSRAEQCFIIIIIICADVYTCIAIKLMQKKLCKQETSSEALQIKIIGSGSGSGSAFVGGSFV